MRQIHRKCIYQQNHSVGLVSHPVISTHSTQKDNIVNHHRTNANISTHAPPVRKCIPITDTLTHGSFQNYLGYELKIRQTSTLSAIMDKTGSCLAAVPQKLPTTISHSALSCLLDDYKDCEFIVNEFKDGFTLGFQGVDTPLHSNNSSATSSPKIVRQKLGIEIEHSRIQGLFNALRFDNFKISPLARREKKEPGNIDFCIIYLFLVIIIPLMLTSLRIAGKIFNH